MVNDNSGLAFPVAFEFSEKWGAEAVHEKGLSKREYFAGLAMQGIMAQAQVPKDASEFARQSVILADALLTELSKPQQ